MNYTFEEEIRNTLIKMTDNIEKKDKVLRIKVLQEMQNENKMKEGFVMKKFLKVCIPVVCLMFVVGIIFTTPIGQTLADTIKKMFEPKQENIMIEGTNEGINMTPIVETPKQESKKVSYAIYMESDSMKKYTAEEAGGVTEYIIPKAIDVKDINKISEKNIEVFMKIEQVVDKNYSEVMNTYIEENKKNGYEKLSEQELSIKNLKAKNTRFSSGPMITTTNNAKSIYKKIYCIDNQQGGTFIITLKMPYGSDYMEGWNTRFENLIKTFEINI